MSDELLEYLADKFIKEEIYEKHQIPFVAYIDQWNRNNTNK